MTIANEESEKNSVPITNNDVEIDNSDLYPERKGNKPRSWWNKVLRIKEREELSKIKCEGNVYNCVKDSKKLICTV